MEVFYLRERNAEEKVGDDESDLVFKLLEGGKMNRLPKKGEIVFGIYELRRRRVSLLFETIVLITFLEP